MPVRLDLNIVHTNDLIKHDAKMSHSKELFFACPYVFERKLDLHPLTFCPIEKKIGPPAIDSTH
jgi:hypothetical protein